MRFHICVFSLACMALPRGLRAAPAPEAGPDDGERQAAARALFEEGLGHLQAERWAEAAERFDRAYALRPSPEIAYNLSSALARTGRLVRASELLRLVAQNPLASDKVRGAAQTRLDQLLPRLARLTVHVEGEAEGVTAHLDDRTLEAALFDVAIPVDPGSHSIEASRGAAKFFERTLTVGEGGSVTITVNVETPRTERRAVAAVPSSRPLAAAAPVEARAAPSRSGVAWLPWTGAAVTAALAGAAVVSGLGVRSRFADLRDSCGATPAGCTEQQIDGLRSRVRLTNILWAAAGTGAIATGVMLLVTPGGEPGVAVALRF